MPPDPEKILTVAPDVIFSTYASEASVADELQEKNRYSGSRTQLWRRQLRHYFNLWRKCAGFTAVDRHYHRRGRKKPRQLLISFRHPLTIWKLAPAVLPMQISPPLTSALWAHVVHMELKAPMGEYILLDVINALNVVDETGESGSIMIDKEKLLGLGPGLYFHRSGWFCHSYRRL